MRPLSLLLAAAFLLAAAPVTAAPKQVIPALKDSATVDGEFVRLGDIIENVGGDAARAAVFKAPELGSTGTIQVYRIIEAARQNGVSVFDTRGVSEVLVTRASRTISIPDLERAVADTAAKQTGISDANNIAVVFDSSIRPFAVEPNAAATVRLIQFSYDPRSQRFDASLDIPGSTVSRRRAMRITGVLYETQEVPMLTRALNRGDIVRDDDMQMVKIAKADVAPDLIRSASALKGQAARRDLRPDIAIRTSDLMKPELVSRGDMVTLTFDSPGVMLTVRARAMESGTQGDTIQVLNPQSKRTLQATVEGPGRVAIHSMKIARTASSDVTGSIK